MGTYLGMAFAFTMADDAVAVSLIVVGVALCLVGPCERLQGGGVENGTGLTWVVVRSQ